MVKGHPTKSSASSDDSNSRQASSAPKKAGPLGIWKIERVAANQAQAVRDKKGPQRGAPLPAQRQGQGVQKQLLLNQDQVQPPEDVDMVIEDIEDSDGEQVQMMAREEEERETHQLNMFERDYRELQKSDRTLIQQAVRMSYKMVGGGKRLMDESDWIAVIAKFPTVDQIPKVVFLKLLNSKRHYEANKVLKKQPQPPAFNAVQDQQQNCAAHYATLKKISVISLKLLQVKAVHFDETEKAILEGSLKLVDKVLLDEETIGLAAGVIKAAHDCEVRKYISFLRTRDASHLDLLDLELTLAQRFQIVISYDLTAQAYEWQVIRLFTCFQDLLEDLTLEQCFTLEFDDATQVIKFIQDATNAHLFGNDAVYSANLIAMLLRQKCLRQILQPQLTNSISIRSRKKTEKVNVTAMKASLASVLETFVKLPDEICKAIAQSPDQLLYDDLIWHLHNEARVFEIIDLVRNTHSDSVCPLSAVVEIQQLLVVKSWLWATIRSNAETEGMTLNRVKQHLIAVKSWHTKQLQACIKKYLFCKCITGKQADALSKHQLSDKQLDLIDQRAYEMAKESGDCNRFEWMIKESKRWLRQSDGSYQHRLGQLYVAAKGARLKKKLTYLQLNPGNGKSNIAIMIYRFVVEEMHKSAVIVVISELLKQQYFELLERLNLHNIVVIEAKDLASHVGKGNVIIFDEYYNELTETKMACKARRQINAIFHLGHPQDKVILMSGHKSTDLDDFLRQLYGNDYEQQINNSIPELFGLPKQEYKPTLTLCSDKDAVRANALSYARELVKHGKAVFTIGLDWTMEEMKDLVAPDTYVAQIKASDDLKLVQNKLGRFKQGVAGLPEGWHIGVNLRFDEDAYVIIACEQIPKAEKVRQTIARGTRSYGPQEGRVIAVGNSEEENHLEGELEKNRGDAFHGAAFNIKMMKAFVKQHSDKEAIKEFCQERGGLWMIPTTEFTESKNKKVAEALQEIKSRF